MKKLLQSACSIIFVFAVTSCKSSSPTIPNPYEAPPPQAKKRESLGLVPRGLDLSNAPKKIAFGSSMDQSKPQSIWQQILNEKPDLMIMMGDNIDASTVETKNMIEQYKKLAKVSDYKKARETIPFMATWNDHDFGVNDGGSDNVTKEDSRKAFWFHWPYVKDSTLLDQPGIFHSKVMGGTREGRGRRAHVTTSVHVIMLDTRWNRSPLKLADVKTVPDAPQTPDTPPQPQQPPPPIKKTYALNDDAKATILGPEQWDWLEDQLREPADVKILVSSIQVIANDQDSEKWGNYPKERQKLLDLIVKTHPKNLIILSGDRRMASIAKLDLKGWGPLYDVTSSGLNQASGSSEKDATYVADSFGKENFGLITIDWSKRVATVEIKGADDKTVQTLDWKLKK
jgi:alkaline phosphatase D